jgi:antitoxin Phd
MSWRLADAKNRFSEVVDRALAGDPQVVLRRRDAVVVIARRDYEKLTGKRVSFKQFLPGRGPLWNDSTFSATHPPCGRSSLRVLLDTCVISELRHPKGHPAVRQAVEALNEEEIFLSVITIGEILKGISLLTESPRKLCCKPG